MDTTYSADIEFNNLKDAEDFAKAWSRHSLSGHTVSPDNIVSIYDIKEEDKEWIDSYINNISPNKTLPPKS